MKRQTKLIVSLLMLSALLFAACGPANNGLQTPGAPGVGDTPIVETPIIDQPLETPLVETPIVETPIVETPIVETPVVETPLVETPLVETPLVETPLAEATEVDEDPVTGVPLEADAPFRLFHLFDQQVLTQDDENLGAMQDALVSNDSGHLLYMTVETGDVGGLGGELRMVPWTAFTPIQVNQDLGVNQVVLNLDADTVRNAPVADMEQNFTTSTTWDQEATAYWQEEGQQIPMTGPEGEVITTNPVVINNVIGSKDVVNTQGESLGEVEDYIVDNETGQILYIVIEAGGILDVGDRLIPVSWQAADFDDEGNIVLNYDPLIFDGAPFFEDWEGIDLSLPDFDAEWEGFWDELSTEPAS